MANELIRISSRFEIVKVLRLFNDCFPRSIEGRVGNLSLYAAKLATQALIYISKDNDLISGLVIFYANDQLTKVAYLSHIAVSADYQNKGIGSLLLQLSYAVSKKNGMTTMKLEVDKSNSKALAYYKKRSFIAIGNASLESQYMIKELI